MRFAILYPFGALAALFGNSDDRSTMAGIWFIVPGLFLRAWSNGYVMKLDKLTTCGPYAFVRHPLYLGTLLIVTGFIVMLKIYYIGVLFLIIMGMVYLNTIKKEEKALQEKFKDVYIDYKNKVPAIVPTVFAYRTGEKWPFSIARLIKSQEYKLFIWMLIVVIAFHLKDELMVEHEALDAKIIWLIAAVFVLSIFDLAGEFIKRWTKST